MGTLGNMLSLCVCILFIIGIETAPAPEPRPWWYNRGMPPQYGDNLFPPPPHVDIFLPPWYPYDSPYDIIINRSPLQRRNRSPDVCCGLMCPCRRDKTGACNNWCGK